jgi:very-short-patch-repair endonuclease
MEKFKGKRLGKKCHKHKETIKILKDKNVKFETEYFNNYYIDIAFPDYKIGLELSGPGHYLFPALILNGRSENRKQTLEKLGWKIHFYPYFFRPENDDGIVNFLNGILPLDF